MIFDLALADLIRPYLLRGETTTWHAALSVIYVESYETTLGSEGLVIRGIARFSGDIDPPSFDPTTGTLRAGAANTEGHPRTQPDRREPWLDITDTKVEFALTVPRIAGDIIAAGEASIPGSDTDFQPVRDVLSAWDPDPSDAPPSDYPGTGFVLDLVLSGIELRPPFLSPAKMEANGLLVPDTTRPDVVFHLPKIKLRVSQGSDSTAVLDVSLLSLGVSGLDDPGDMAAAELITMEPAYAFIGSGRVVGFAFRSAFLDLSDGYTPPEVLDQFGFDDAWTGLYLPEIRLFFAPNGAEDFAVNAGVENLLIGLGDSSGITGDFDLAIINQGSGELTLSARFFDQQGRAIGITRLNDTTAEVRLPATTRLLVDVVGGRAPYSINAEFDGAGHAGIVHDISLGASGKTITITATDTSSPQKSRTLTVTANLREANLVQPAPGAQPDLSANLTTTSITLEGQPQTAPPLRLISDSGDSVVIAVEGVVPDPATEWQADGGPTSSSATFQVNLTGGQSKTIRAVLPGETFTRIDGYFRFDKPGQSDPANYVLNPDNTSADQAVDPSSNASWKPPARQFIPAWQEVLSRITPKSITIEGTASYEGDDQKATYNYLLSQRRADGLRTLIESEPALAGFTVNLLPTPIGPGATPPVSWTGNAGSGWKSHGEPREVWWKAEIRDFTVNMPGPVIEGEVERPAAPTPPPPQPPTRDDPPDNPPPPSWFRSARLKVRVVQDQFVALELSGSVDFETALEEQLDTTGGVSVPSIEGLGNNPADGIVDYLFLYQTDPASQSDEIKLYIGADPNDKDGLVKTGQLQGQALQAPNTGRNILGMTTVFTPLLAEIAPANPADGGIAPIVLSAAVVALPSALAEIRVDGEPLLNVERVVLFGGEAAFRRQGDRWETSILFDVETAISAKIKLGGFLLLEIPRESPLAVRYKAIGLKFGYPPGSTAAWELRPVFDQSKGYTIDVSGPGQIRLPDPLGQILQVLGARIARTNPLNFEIDLGFAIDLGVISVDRARIRLPLEPLGPPELTAFGAGLKVPGVIEGKGYMEMNNSGGAMEIKGGIDVSLIPVKLRVAAQIAVAQIPASQGGPATGVAIALEVELPVAIPLAQSGFGIYGFLGLFAMHYARDEDGITSLTPALAWLKDRAQGNPTNLQAWKPELNKWAFGVGITLGTMGSPIIFNVKGMFLLELPGPRVLLVVKANLLAVLPALKDKNAEGTFLCVIDLDFGRGTLTIGLSIDFSIDPIVEIRIPIEAYFNLEDGGDWHVYLGTFPGNDGLGRPMPGPIRIKILEVFDGAGYVMISGHGIPSYQPPGTNLPALPAVQGTALAMGLEVSLVWGNTSINLYLRVTAGFNAILGFDPFYVGGLLYLRGELKLFIISLSASAGLAVQIGQKVVDGVRSEISRIDGEVCGELDLFFFTLKGCVDFHIGEENKILPPAPKLVTATSLVSRSPALVQGTGVDRGIDSKIGDGIASATQPSDISTLPEVPIDAIPVLTMSATPRDDSLSVMGSSPEGSPGAPADGFVKRGDFAYRYDLAEVRLETADGSPALMDGNKPSVWWTHNAPTDTNLTAQLALLNWTPNPTPKALERTEHLVDTVIDRWGTICHDAAPAAAVLWTFCDEPLGPSESGWTLKGIAWPDPADTDRSTEPELSLKVHETWRTGVRDLDRRRGLVPAIIQGGKVRCFPARDNGAGNDDRTHETVQPGIALPHDIADLLRERPLITEIDPRARVPLGNSTPAERASLGTVADRIRTRAGRLTRFSDRLSADRARLTAATEGSFGRRFADRLDANPLVISEALRRVAAGDIVHRSELLSGLTALSPEATNNAATGSVTAGASTPPKPGEASCDGRVLASPLWDIGEPVVFGNRAEADTFAEQLDALNHKHGPLSDVIQIDSGPIKAGAILLWASERLLNKETGAGRNLVIHYLDDEDQVIGERPVRVTDLVSLTGLPPRWTDMNGPWVECIYHTVLYGQTRLGQRSALFVEIEPPAGTTRINIGMLYPDLKTAQKMERLGRPYFVGAIELTTEAEATRESYDQTQIERNRSVVESFLGPESGNIALMFPGKTYKVTTVTNVSVRDDEGTVQSGDVQTESFWFRTDDEAPRRLDPWLLCTTPAEKEQHVFGHEELKVVFATNDVDRLYGAYGKELRARLKAASFRQVEEPGVPHPFPITAATLDNVKADALSPFEGVLVDVMAEVGPCVPVDGERVRQTTVTIPIPLDPYTDYVLDIEAVDIGAPANTVGQRVLRRSFSTGAFASTEDFVTQFAGTATEHRAIATGALQAIATQFASRQPEGAEFDNALIGAGLEPMGVPSHPRVLVFWQQTDPTSDPQPVAVMVDSSEPMHRTRALPEEVTSGDDVPVTRLALTEQEWLTMAEGSSGDGIVAQVIYAPGRQRALCILKPLSRNKILHLELVRKAFTAPYLDGDSATDQSYRIVSETLRHAPWEEA
ncbi:DUF6603 domain-containing protein [Marinobacter mobilis]|uniref:Uncharacterized protein n=1 Tax=Marinobacter mobilis TaxID=488533 RepID=A0A1H3BGJ3_9GAMM|nr:DUF6603 domain-containing protein [Marinobacter mobilis]SDX40905.1 hypothetical protein SAMN04487960_10918 [Marinobacter mobilis]